MLIQISDACQCPINDVYGNLEVRIGHMKPRSVVQRSVGYKGKIVVDGDTFGDRFGEDDDGEDGINYSPPPVNADTMGIRYVKILKCYLLIFVLDMRFLIGREGERPVHNARVQNFAMRDAGQRTPKTARVFSFIFFVSLVELTN